jgi:hypothetical protein
VLYFGTLAVANFLGMMSCDLLEYSTPSGADGTIGLFGFRLDHHHGECLPYSQYAEADDTFRPARVGAMMALTLAVGLLCLNIIHYSFYAIPQKEIVFYIIGALQQLSLALTQVLLWNGLCETYGCTMAQGNSWIGLAHIMYLGSTCINLFIDTPDHIKLTRGQKSGNGTLKQQLFSITSPLTRQGSVRTL